MGLLSLPPELLLGLPNFLAQSDVNSLSQVNRLLHDYVNPYLYLNNARYFDSSALLWASRNGSSATVKRFFETVKRKRPNGVTSAFIKALQHGHEEVVKILLENSDIDVDARMDTGGTPPFIAAAFGHTALVDLLLNTGKVDIEASQFRDGTPLCIAAKYGHVEVVKLLLATGRVNTEATNSAGETPLYLAAKMGHEEMVELLLERGVDMGAKSLRA